MNTHKTMNAALLFLALLISSTSSSAQVYDLGVDEFLDQWGPTDSLFWTDPSNNYTLRIDSFGKLNTAFDLGLETTITGKVTARDLGDGTWQVTALIHARDAFCQGTNFSTMPPTPLFGYPPGAVANGVGPAAIGDTTYRLVYAPQPIGQFDVFGEKEVFSGTVMCQGLLRAGSGYPEGTPGLAQTTQTSVLTSGVPSGCPPEKDGDCYPAEKVQFKPIGN